MNREEAAKWAIGKRLRLKCGTPFKDETGIVTEAHPQFGGGGIDGKITSDITPSMWVKFSYPNGSEFINVELPEEIFGKAKK